MDLAWARSIVAQCRAAGVACFVKQLGARPLSLDPRDDALPRVAGRSEQLRLRDRKGGGDMAEWPEDLRIRQFPNMGSDGRAAPADGAHDDGDLAPAGAEQDGELGCGVHGASVPRGGASAEGGTA